MPAVLVAALFFGCGRGSRPPAREAAPAPVETGALTPAEAPPEESQDWVVAASSDSAYEIGRALPPGTSLAPSAPLQVASPRGALITLASGARGEIAAPDGEGEKIALEGGRLRVEVLLGNPFHVSTPVATIGVRGTDFAVTFEAGASDVAVFEDTVSLAAAGREELLGADREARVDAARMAVQAMRPATRERFERMREEIADRLMDRFGITLEGDPSDKLQAVLDRLPEHIREKVRERMHANVDRRMNMLQEALDRSGARDTSLPPHERMRRAREAFEKVGQGERNRMRGEATKFHRDNAARFRDAAGQVEARWGERGETAAARLREAAEQAEGEAARIENQRAPKLTIDVAPPGRRVVSHPMPPVAPDNPLRTHRVVLVLDVKIGPFGVVQAARLVEGEVPGLGKSEVEAAVRHWHFDEIPMREGIKHYRIVVSTVPD